MISKIIIFTLLIVDVILLIWLLIGHSTVAVLAPKGIIAFQERSLIFSALGIMFIVVIPVFLATFLIVHKYRADNAKATYEPDWHHDAKLQALWWGILCTIIGVLCVINWHAAHALDPHTPINSAVKPLTIQVVALQWKWLFIYPEEGIATVNYIAFPEKTPITFELTGDAPMNSFWIPQLGGQMYAMAGMVTHLPLMADNRGEYRGSSAEISGRGFAGMRFTAKSVSKNDFDAWVAFVKQSPQILSLDEYKRLAKPSEDTPPAYYSSTENNLYNTIVMQFMPHHLMEPKSNSMETGQEPPVGSGRGANVEHGMPGMPGM